MILLALGSHAILFLQCSSPPCSCFRNTLPRKKKKRKTYAQFEKDFMDVLKKVNSWHATMVLSPLKPHRLDGLNLNKILERLSLIC